MGRRTARAAAGYHAFRRVAPAGFEPAGRGIVPAVRPGRSPRSVSLCVSQVEWHLMQLRSPLQPARAPVAALERIEEVRAALSSSNPVDDLISHGLHDFLDALQRDLILLAGEIGYAFFRDWRPEPQAQRQAQSAAPVPEPVSAAAAPPGDRDRRQRLAPWWRSAADVPPRPARARAGWPGPAAPPPQSAQRPSAW